MLQNKNKNKIISRRLRWAGHVAPVEERRRGYGVLVGKPEGRTLGKPRRRWRDNIKVDLREVGAVARTGSIWHWIGTSGGLLSLR